ncbi:hypothetical protein CLV59_105435 [Chitinophaga dinghuensis]|uniref:Lipoprotein n=1 Tax=Chitinophaga dinghuensis TaxID=1539050 RepID=A0A327VZE3_9BACT|nr:hypothetical protein [Chitinophaga dinghuensis]RAJ80326.1 hypothetical protein CLV59_105435 [Chitinophaga dinghuensis]
MKFAGYLLVLSATVAVACQNPQKHDEREAVQKSNEAAQAAENAAASQAASDASAVNAADAAVQANIDAAMAKVNVPSFKKENAKSLALEFHKYLADLINTNSGVKAKQYMDKIDALKVDFEKKEAAAKLDPEDQTKLRMYVNDLVNAAVQANP